MARSFFSVIDNLSLQDVESEADLIPLMTTEDEEALESEALPEIVPILPLKNTVLFPGVVIPITAGRDKSIKLIKDANSKDKTIQCPPTSTKLGKGLRLFSGDTKVVQNYNEKTFLSQTVRAEFENFL